MQNTDKVGKSLPEPTFLAFSMYQNYHRNLGGSLALYILCRIYKHRTKVAIYHYWDSPSYWSFLSPLVLICRPSVHGVLQKEFESFFSCYFFFIFFLKPMTVDMTIN